MKNEALTSKRRLAQIISILHKHQITRGIDPVKLREIIEDLGPTFVKIGQLMSSRQDMFSKRYCDELMKLRTQVAPMDTDTVRSILRVNMAVGQKRCSCDLIHRRWALLPSHRSIGPCCSAGKKWSSRCSVRISMSGWNGTSRC